MLTESQLRRARYLNTRPQSEWTPAERMGLLEGDWVTSLISGNEFFLIGDDGRLAPTFTESGSYDPDLGAWMSIRLSVQSMRPYQPPWWERLAHYEASQSVGQEQETEGGPAL